MDRLSREAMALDREPLAPASLRAGVVALGARRTSVLEGLQRQAQELRAGRFSQGLSSRQRCSVSKMADDQFGRLLKRPARRKTKRTRQRTRDTRVMVEPSSKPAVALYNSSPHCGRLGPEKH